MNSSDPKDESRQDRNVVSININAPVERLISMSDCVSVHFHFGQQDVDSISDDGRPIDVGKMVKDAIQGARSIQPSNMVEQS